LSLASSVSAIDGIKDFYIVGPFGDLISFWGPTEWTEVHLHDAKGDHKIAGSPGKSPVSVSAVRDPSGYARAAILFDDGTLYDYFDQTKTMKYEGAGVLQASAGYAFDAILYDAWYQPAWQHPLCYTDPYAAKTIAVVSSNVVSMSAGEDRDFLPMIAYVNDSGNAYEWRLGTTAGTGYTESLGSSVAQVSAGQNGVVALLSVAGTATNHYDDAYVSFGGAFTSPGTSKFLAADAVEVSAGTDRAGWAMTDVLDKNGVATEYSDLRGKVALDSSFEVDAGLDGISDVVSLLSDNGRYIYATERFQDGWAWLPASDVDLPWNPDNYPDF
jgi:hypothetical protein